MSSAPTANPSGTATAARSGKKRRQRRWRNLHEVGAAALGDVVHRSLCTVDNSGVWRDRKGLEQHLESKGISGVLLTAPGKGDLKNIVYGINHDTIEDSDKII